MRRGGRRRKQLLYDRIKRENAGIWKLKY